MDLPTETWLPNVDSLIASRAMATAIVAIPPATTPHPAVLDPDRAGAREQENDADGGPLRT